MATIDKCNGCGLGPRYALKDDDKICATCAKLKSKLRTVKTDKNDEVQTGESK